MNSILIGELDSHVLLDSIESPATIVYFAFCCTRQEFQKFTYFLRGIFAGCGRNYSWSPCACFEFDKNVMRQSFRSWAAVCVENDDTFNCGRKLYHVGMFRRSRLTNYGHSYSWSQFSSRNTPKANIRTSIATSKSYRATSAICPSIRTSLRTFSSMWTRRWCGTARCLPSASDMICTKLSFLGPYAYVKLWVLLCAFVARLHKVCFGDFSSIVYADWRIINTSSFVYVSVSSQTCETLTIRYVKLCFYYANAAVFLLLPTRACFGGFSPMLRDGFAKERKKNISCSVWFSASSQAFEAFTLKGGYRGGRHAKFYSYKFKTAAPKRCYKQNDFATWTNVLCDNSFLLNQVSCFCVASLTL